MLIFMLGATIAGSQYSRLGTQGIGIACILFFWLHGVAYALAWSGLLVAYTVEVLPFKLRAKGLFIMNVSVQVALVINQYVNPIPLEGAWQGSEWKLYCVYTAWIACELVFVYFFYVETRYEYPCCERAESMLTSYRRGPTLEEIARIFDGENAEVGEADVKEIRGLSNAGFDEKPTVNTYEKA